VRHNPWPKTIRK